MKQDFSTFSDHWAWFRTASVCDLSNSSHLVLTFGLRKSIHPVGCLLRNFENGEVE